MSQDIKIFNACNHIVENKYYEPQLCPRCYSNGYYFDIHFDEQGKAVTTTGAIKLQQEILKVLVDEKYNNLFHENWGSQIHNMIGHKNLSITKARLEILVREALNYLQNVQLNEYYNVRNLNESEILDKILYIEINPVVPTGYQINVVISNTTGDIYSQSITF